MKYEKYKDSGVEWIGDIPLTWTTSTLLQVLRARISDGPHETPNLVDEGIPFISVDSLNDSEDIDFEIVKKYISDEDYKQYKKKACLEKGDILFTKSATIGKTAIVKDDIFMVWSPIAILKPNKLIYNKYLYYLVSNDFFKDYICQLSTFSTQFNVGMRTLEKAKICFPSLPEQQAIANYLDEKCAKINGSIDVQKRKIELLNELKQTIITDAVTKGLNPHAPMKNSGVEWIGEVPEHWEVMKMNFACKVITDYVASGSFADLRTNVAYLDEPDFAMLVRTADLSQKDKNISRVYINRASYDFLSNSNLFGGEIVLPNIGASIGDVYMVPYGLYENMSLAPNSIMVKSKTSDEYMYYFFSSKVGRESLNIIGSAAAQGKFNKTELRALRIPIPPLEEQDLAINHIKEKIAPIDTQISKANRRIELLNELKQSIITEAVTGKIKVC